MSGLKVQLSLTILTILISGMLLTNVVMMSLWQQDAVEREAARLELLLEVSTLDIDQDELTTGNAVSEILRALHEEDVSCVKISLVGENVTVPKGCKSEKTLAAIADETARSGKGSVSFNGAAFGVVTLGKRFLRVVEPVFCDERQVGVVAIEKNLKPLYKELRQKERVVFVYIILNTILLATIGFFRLVSVVTRPLDRLVEVADTYSQSSSFMLLNEKPGSEFGRLSSSLNGMLAQIEKDNLKLRTTVDSLEKANQEAVNTRKKMILTEKLASMGRLSAGLAHEIGNPLAIVQGYIELLGQGATSQEEREQFAYRAGKEVERIDALIKQLLDVSRKSAIPKSSVRVQTVLEELVGFLSDQRKNDHIEFQINFGAVDDTVTAASDGLKQVFLNCLINCIDAIGEGGAADAGIIKIVTTNKTDSQGVGYLQITIGDNGCGIAEADLDNVFDPFFTSKEPGKGTGLGLAVSHTLVENVGGSIYIKANQQLGTDVVIELPLENSISSHSHLAE